MKRISSTLVALVLGAGLASPLFAGDVCIAEKQNLKGQTFVAKEVLYDTKVSTEGIVALEWDKEAIPKGSKFRIVDIECKTKKIELTLQPATSGKAAKVEIFFMITAEERSGSDGKDKLQKIMDWVFAAPDE